MPVCGRGLSCRRKTLSISKINAFRLSSLRPHEIGFKRQTLCQLRGSENCSGEVAQRTVNRILRGKDTYISFEGGTLVLRETVTMLRSRDVIHRGPASV